MLLRGARTVEPLGRLESVMARRRRLMENEPFVSAAGRLLRRLKAPQSLYMGQIDGSKN